MPRVNPRILFLFFPLLLVGCGSIGSNGGGDTSFTFPKKIEITEAGVPDFNLEDVNGNSINLSDFDGKPLVLNSWATWCPFCKNELQDFVTVQKEFGIDKVVFIAIDRGESLEQIRGFINEMNITNNLIFLIDSHDAFYKAIEGFSMPETLFVNGEGKIIHHKRGPMTVEEIREKIADIL